jgi:peptidyl-prolyl isomerase E (cyclophilin E)
MDMNELQGKVLKVSLARPQRGPVQGAGNRAGGLKGLVSDLYADLPLIVWETEEWLRTNTKPVAENGGSAAKSSGAGANGDAKDEDAMEE